ncbi:hypothetical protein CO540_13455 [Micromonospora sp. WMMA2032]|uniref:hypothetical protein n=1 Tax=Micromonospora sp. WMMA2032 TaxID=2039870 RepID=UPI000C05AC93|nr:hypothetical protein [Micromonospora sp. WMMA2032]ATO14713.1 hypothetical protein CO540_13455 [Micromonospora sp. WMMA2032]
MAQQAPKPPTKRLFAAACLTGGATIGSIAIVGVGHFGYGSIPTGRLIAYSAAILVGACIAGALAARYVVQKCRRDSWWDGHAASEAPTPEAIPLRRIQAELEQLTEAVIDLADAAGRPRTSQPPAQSQPSVYASRAAQGDTVAFARQAEPSDSDTRVRLVEPKPADPVAEARAQGYAEGYVDGIARRRDAEGAAD